MNVLGPGPSISDVGKLKLIDFVREEESIWNPKFPDYIKPDLKLAAWNRVQSLMKSEGFDFTLSFLRRVWNNLLVYWKKIHHYSRKPAGKIWPFEKPLRFIVRRYGVRYQPSKSRPTAEEDGDESCEEDQADDVFDADDWLASLSADSEPVTGGADLELETSASSSLDRTTVQDNVPVRTSGRIRKKRSFYGDFVEDIFVKKERSEEREPERRSVSSDGESHQRHHYRQQHPLPVDKSDNNNVHVKKESGEEPEPDPDSTTSSGEDQRLQKQKSLALDKFDKYAAFLASTLRDMPEEESKKKMKEIMLVLLEDVYA